MQRTTRVDNNIKKIELMKTFAELFKRYRLRAEFARLSQFADALAQKGYFYELSIFCH